MARKTLKSVAYAAIRDAILSGQLRPYTPLSEAQMEEMLGISRTPIREALERLAHENLVILTPHKGATVTGVGLDDCQDIFLIREHLEGLAAALCAVRVPAQQLDPLTAEYDHLVERVSDEIHLVAFGKNLHTVIQECNGSQRLIHLLRMLRQEHDRLGFFQLTASGRIRQAFFEHGDILAALRARNPSDAEAAMRLHVRRSGDTALQLMLVAPHHVHEPPINDVESSALHTKMEAPA